MEMQKNKAGLYKPALQSIDTVYGLLKHLFCINLFNSVPALVKFPVFILLFTSTVYCSLNIYICLAN